MSLIMMPLPSSPGSSSSFELPPLIPLPNRQTSLTDVDELHTPKPEVPPMPLLPLPLASASTSAAMQPLPPPLPLLPTLPSTMKHEQPCSSPSLVAPLPLLPLPLPLDNKQDINALGSVNVGPLVVDHHRLPTQDSFALQPLPIKRPTSPVSASDPFLSGPTDLRHSFKDEAPLTPPASMTDVAQPQLSVTPSLSAEVGGDLSSFLSIGGLGHGTSPSDLMSYDSSGNLAMGLSHDMHMSSSSAHLDSSETVTNSSIVGMDMLGDGMSMAMHDDSHAASHSTLSSMIADDDMGAATSASHLNFADDISVFHDPYDVRVSPMCCFIRFLAWFCFREKASDVFLCWTDAGMPSVILRVFVDNRQTYNSWPAWWSMPDHGDRDALRYSRSSLLCTEPDSFSANVVACHSILRMSVDRAVQCLQSVPPLCARSIFAYICVVREVVTFPGVRIMT